MTESSPAASSTSGLVEVYLLCSMSYTGPLYDTPSGHVENTITVDETTASTTSTASEVIGEQSWTVCHDARGHEHEFKITAAEYEALKIRGTPQKSVMESPEEAALDSFPVEATPALATGTTTPEVLGTSTSASESASNTSPEAADADTSQTTTSDATSTPAPADAPDDSISSTTPDVTSDTGDS